jgi:hypothetical protein
MSLSVRDVGRSGQVAVPNAKAMAELMDDSAYG